jgi:hypothetical protein
MQERDNPIAYLDSSGFGDYLDCCMSCAWNEYRLTRFQKRDSAPEERNSGRRDWCVLRQSPLPQSHTSTVLCSEYQPAVVLPVALSRPSLTDIHRLPVDYLCYSNPWDPEVPKTLMKLQPAVADADAP